VTPTRRADELPDEVVAALVAALATLSDGADDAEPSVWRASGNVSPRWRADGAGAWRTRERERGWTNP
jgi:hypothetical protein